jgi:hypothetical protein
MQMAVSIIEVNSRSDLKRWVKLPFDMYRNNPYYVPQILREEVAFFTSKNPVFEIVKMKQFLALMGNTPVGRICGIIHPYEEKKLGYRRGRFGWFETIDNYEVSHLLLTRVREWLESEDCVEMTGPHGFTDLDPEGLLIEGFDELATISTSYNFPYYQKHLERFGLDKDIDYQEYLVTLPVEEPPLLLRMRKQMERETEFRVVQCRSKKEIMGHAAQFWELLDESFRDLYGVVPLSPKQKDFYTKKYLSYLDPFFVHFVFTGEDKMVGFYLGLPNLSRGFQKAKSRLFPFGIFHIDLFGQSRAAPLHTDRDFLFGRTWNRSRPEMPFIVTTCAPPCV